MFKDIKADLFRVYPNGSFFSFFVGILINPSVHAVILIRFQLASGRAGYWFFRNILIWKHGIDVGYGAKIGAGFYMPHPLNIVIGKGVVVKSNCTVYQGVTLGKKNKFYPTIESGCIIFPNSIVVGNIILPEGYFVQPLTLVDSNYNLKRKY